MRTLLALLLSILVSQAAPSTPTTGIRLTYWFGVNNQVNETCLDPSCGTSVSTHPKKNTILSVYSQPVPESTTKTIFQYIDLGACCAKATFRSEWNNSTNGQERITWTPPGDTTTNFLSSLNVGEYYGKGSTTRSYTNGDTTYYNTKTISASTTALFEATNGTPNYRYIYKVTFNCHSKQLDSAGELETISNPVTYTNVTSPAGPVYWDGANSRCYVEFQVLFGTPASLFTQNLVPSVSGNPYFTYEFYTITLLSVEPL